MTESLVLRDYTPPRGHGETVVWFAIAWEGPDGNALSRRAWEIAMQMADGTHVWRYNEPREGPPRRWVTVGMSAATKRRTMEAIFDACHEVEGGHAILLPDDLLFALAQRRRKMMVERTMAGDFGLKRIEGRPRHMDKRGNMHDAS